MPVQAWIVMNDAQNAVAVALDDEDARIGSRRIDNPLANNLGYGTLVSAWVAPARLLNDPEFARWVPTLGILPIYVLDSDTLFVPGPTA